MITNTPDYAARLATAICLFGPIGFFHTTHAYKPDNTGPVLGIDFFTFIFLRKTVPDYLTFIQATYSEFLGFS